jgi:hypothetical protein
MKNKAIAEPSILRLSLLWLISTIISCSILNPSFAQSASQKITLGNQVDPDPLILKGMSGGKIRATEMVNTEGTTTGFCNGFVNDRPNHVLVLSNFFEFLKIEVASSIDTTIVVEGPGGVWCNDDFNDTNPALEGQWQPGRYKIWIGSYQADTDNIYQIKITGQN